MDELRRALDALLERKRVVTSYFTGLEGVTGTQAMLWERAREIAGRAAGRLGGKPNFLDRLGEAMLRPWPGVPLALLILAVSLGFVAGGGELLRTKLLMPLVDGIIVPFFERFFTSLNLHPLLESVLIGNYGIFRIGFEWIVALVMPYVLLFQVQFAFLEDSGVLPRLAVLFDGVMRKLGVQGEPYPDVPRFRLRCPGCHRHPRGYHEEGAAHGHRHDLLCHPLHLPDGRALDAVHGVFAVARRRDGGGGGGCARVRVGHTEQGD